MVFVHACLQFQLRTSHNFDSVHPLRLIKLRLHILFPTKDVADIAFQKDTSCHSNYVFACVQKCLEISPKFVRNLSSVPPKYWS